MLLNKIFQCRQKNSGIIVWSYKDPSDNYIDEDIRDINVSISINAVDRFVTRLANASWEHNLTFELAELPPNSPYNTDSPNEVFGKDYIPVVFATLIIRITTNQTNQIEINGDKITFFLHIDSLPQFIFYSLRSKKRAYIGDFVIKFATIEGGSTYENNLVFWSNNYGRPIFHP